MRLLERLLIDLLVIAFASMLGALVWTSIPAVAAFVAGMPHEALAAWAIVSLVAAVALDLHTTGLPPATPPKARLSRRMAVLLVATEMRWPIFVAWLRQPSTIYGLAGLVGTVAAYAEGSLTVSQTIPVALGALVAILLPERPGASDTATRIAADALLLLNPATRTRAVAGLAEDAKDLAGVVASQPPAAVFGSLGSGHDLSGK